MGIKSSKKSLVASLLGLMAVLFISGLSISGFAADELTDPVLATTSRNDHSTLNIPRWKGYMSPQDFNKFWISYANSSTDGGNLVYTEDGGQSWSTQTVQIDQSGWMDYHLSMFGSGEDLYFTWPGSSSIEFRKFNEPSIAEDDRGPLVNFSGTDNSHRSNVTVDGNGSVWVFTRLSGTPSENVRFRRTDNDGGSWTQGTAFATGADEVRFGSMPYVNGNPALIVLYLNDPRGYEYYLWNGNQFVANEDRSIFGENMGYERAFTHNVIRDTTMHLVFGHENVLRHRWKDYQNGQGVWHDEIIDQSASTFGMEWYPTSTVRGDELYVFYTKKSSSSDQTSRVYYAKWDQVTETWTDPRLVSTNAANTYCIYPNTCFEVPEHSNYIPVFWQSSGSSPYQVWYASVLPDGGSSVDVIPPSAIGNLSANPGSEPGQLRLAWTATGDDGTTGTATSYQIRYSLDRITDANWSSASLYPSAPSPGTAGSAQSFTLSSLPDGVQYYFGIRAYDERGNESDVSNSPISFVGGIQSPETLPFWYDHQAGTLVTRCSLVDSYLDIDYEFALDTGSFWNDPLIKTGVVGGGVASINYSNLIDGVQYMWWCRAINVDGSVASDWEGPVVFTAGAPCCEGRTGNVDNDPDGMVDIADLTELIAYLFIDFELPECIEEANTDGDIDGVVDISDLNVMITYLFIDFEPPADCLDRQ